VRHHFLAALRIVGTRDPKGVASQSSPHQGMSLPVFVLNMVADLCPHGMLPLAYGKQIHFPVRVLVLTFS
jgi:hypothetical protein